MITTARSNDGTAKATVTFKGYYYGQATTTFTINPKGTGLSKVTAQKKGFKATWKKQTYKTVGKTKYYSSWSKAKTVTTKK